MCRVRRIALYSPATPSRTKAGAGTGTAIAADINHMIDFVTDRPRQTLSESELQHRLFSHLAGQREFMTGGMKKLNEFHYKGIPDFVLREGQFFEPRSLPDRMGHLEIKQCFKNAFLTALQEGFVFVEGYALSSSHDLPLLHAWNLDREGFVVDRTWNPHGRLYFGVIFPLAAVPFEGGKQYPVIDDWEHGYPILRNPWDREVARNQAFEELQKETRGTRSE